MTIAAPEDIAKSFREAARRLGTRPRLVRALIRTTAGRLARSAVRGARVEAIRSALKLSSGSVDADVLRRGSAVIIQLCSANSWVSIADESGLSDAEAQKAVSWAIDALIDALRRCPRGPRR